MKHKNESHLPKRVIIEFLRRHSIKIRRTVVGGVRVWEASNPFGEVFHHTSLQGVYWAYQRVAAGKTDDRTPAGIQEMIQEAELLKGLEYVKGVDQGGNEKTVQVTVGIGSDGKPELTAMDQDPQIQGIVRELKIDHSTWDAAKNGGLTE